MPSLGAQSAGVASLDSTLVQQTKSEIRTLAAEIAELAHSGVEVDEFFDGFLPRVCVAMGASASAVWKVNEDGIVLAASHMLPSQLSVVIETNEQVPSEAHLAILRSAIADGQPVLVPPSSVTVEVDRPTNPLAESLIIVPVRIEDDIEFVVEVVQKPSGGPAAQRGYLRFVAQMADLLADFFRRNKLRQFQEQTESLELLESCLIDIASQDSFPRRAQVAADALADLVAAELCGIVEIRGRKIHSLALSGIAAIDPRSEVTLLLERLTRLVNDEQVVTGQGPVWLQATERRKATESPIENHETDIEEGNFRTELDCLFDLLHCRSAVVAPLDDHGDTLAWMFFSTGSPGASTNDRRTSVPRLTSSVGSLLVASRPRPSFWSSWLPFQTLRTRQASGIQQIQRWISRVAIVGLLVVLAAFPVPQQISATATLLPVEKLPYYAPCDGVVRSVLVQEGASVSKGQALVQLVSRKLSAQLDALKGKMRINEDRRSQIKDLLDRGVTLSDLESDKLEGELKQLQIQQATNRQELDVIRQQLQELEVQAIGPGVVSSWDLQNRLLNRPVVAGDLLVTTFVPNGQWKLQLSIPDYRAGIVASRLAKQSGDNRGVPVQFSLSSHPDQLQEAALVRLGSHAIRAPAGNSGQENSIVIGEAMLDIEKLPLAKDGAIARATIDCGKVPAIWLMVRDAYWAISSRVQMIW